MQDYSYLQYTILESLFHCRMTILGDRAQTLDTKQQDVLRFLPKLLGREIRTIEIKKSYRNTLEIARYAEKVSGVSDLELLDRHGKEVVEKTFNTDTELLDELVCHLKCPGDFETAALITTTEEEAFDLSRLLKLRGINVSYVDRNSSAFKKGLTVTTFYLAKVLRASWSLSTPTMISNPASINPFDNPPHPANKSIAFIYLLSSVSFSCLNSQISEISQSKLEHIFISTSMLTT